ncbi:MAG: fimbrial protein FimV [Ramlibacter sp.]|nr:fimbrial protein FimV [Ramlibacter sp.]
MIRKKLPADRAMEAHKLTGKPTRWQASAMALGIAMMTGIASPEAHALALGRITVQSALGEPLRADIDIPEITPDEASSLKAVVASPDAFRAAGLEYNAVITNLQISLHERPGGRMFLRLTSDRVVNDPFIDLILEANWSSGRIVRDYTMLFDPPALRPLGPPPATIAQVPAAPRPAAAASPAPAAATARPVAPAPAMAASPQPLRPQTPRPAVTATPQPAPASSGATRQVIVKAGDTAGRIASANMPANVSLDQMLVALLRANPDAFIQGNVNRVKAGAVLDIPAAEQAALVEPGEARRTIVAQARDFNEFRRKLAGTVPATEVAAANRQASGKVQAKVEDKQPAAQAPDKLTLSKGAVQSKNAVDKIAKDRAAQDAAARVAELNKNIADLSKLGAASSGPGGAAAAAKPAASAPKVGVEVATGAVAAASAAKPAASAPAAAAPASAAASAAVASATPASAPAAATAAAAASAPAEPAAAAPAPVAAPAPAPVAPPPPAPAPKPAAPKVAPPPPVEPSLLDELMDNWPILAGVAGVVVLLLGFGFYRIRQRKKSTQVDSSFLESRLQPDSFFGASGGQRIDTNEGGPTGSSMVYSPSQLDAAGDVDPVAEADVYLAYGRDLQAEEILKEALRTTPQRVAIHGKLLEIYSKRRDAKAFEYIASEAFGLTRGEGPDWEHICELGRDLDPANPMYQPGGQPSPGGVAPPAPASQDNFAMATATHVLPQDAAPAPPAVDLDLDLDFSIGDDAPVDLQATTPMQIEPTVAFAAPPAPVEPAPALDMDFGSATISLPPSAVPAPVAAPVIEEPVRLSAPDLALSENDLSFSPDTLGKTAPIMALPTPVPPPPAPAPEADAGMIEFDLGALSLDLPASAPSAPAEGGDTAGTPLSTGFDDSGADPLSTKLALAEEFSAIGDPDGARSLAEEVVAEATGALKAKAQRFLAELA